MKFSLCIEPIFENLNFCDRIKMAKECGVDAIEFWGSENKDLDKIASTCANINMPIAAISVCDSWQVRLNDTRESVLKKIKQSIEVGKHINCTTFIGLSGDVTSDDKSQQHIIEENLKAAAQLLEKENMTVVVEALNSTVDHVGYYLDSSKKMFDIIKNVNSKSVKGLYDCYHMQVMEGNLVCNILNNIDYIGHFHAAGVPFRHEIYTGEINYAHIVEQIKSTAYSGFFGIEYWPECDNKESLLKTMKVLRTN